MYFFLKLNVTNSSFSEKALDNMNKETSLFFSTTHDGQIKYLYERPFLPFLTENENNTIDLSSFQFDCNDYRNYWLKKSKNF